MSGKSVRNGGGRRNGGNAKIISSDASNVVEFQRSKSRRYPRCLKLQKGDAKMDIRMSSATKRNIVKLAGRRRQSPSSLMSNLALFVGYIEEAAADCNRQHHDPHID